jgi:hypothetical protein
VKPRPHTHTKYGLKFPAEYHNKMRDAPFPEPSYICLSKVPVNNPPTGAPMERVVHLQSLLLHTNFLIKFPY